MQLEVMDVNNVKPVKSPEVATSPIKAAQRSASELSADKVNTSRSDSVRVDVSEKPERPERTNRSREKANEVINTLNVVADVADELDKIVTSLAGLAEQASDGELPDSRKKILEDEARELLSALDDRAQVTTERGIKPLQGDPIELEVEEELGKTLKVILPETSKESLGLGQVTVSKVDTILQTRRSIEEARDRLEELRDAVLDSKSDVKQVLNEADIAVQNREAAETSIRDVDAALELTGGIKGFISDNPDLALDAAAINRVNPQLLDSE